MDTNFSNKYKSIIVDKLFPENYPRTILVTWIVFCCIFFSIYKELNVPTTVASLSILSVILFGYILWILLFTIDGQYFYDTYLSYYFEIASYPKKIRIYFILATSSIGCLVGFYIGFLHRGSVSNVAYWNAFAIGVLLGFIAFLRIPNYTISRHRKNITLAFNFSRISLPIIFAPIVANPNNLALWGAGILGYSISYFIAEVAILIRHYSINYALTKIILPDDPINEYTQDELARELYIDKNILKAKRNLTIDDLCGIRTKCYQEVTKKIIHDSTLYRIFKPKALESPEALRDAFRIWYSEREYYKIIKLGDKYIRHHVEKNSYENLSYVITSLYFKSLIRVGDNNLTQKKYLEQYGKKFNRIFYGVERASSLWNIGRTQDAVKEIRQLLIEEPKFIIAKNCLAYYLSEISATLIFSSKKIQNEDSQKALLKKSSECINEAEKLLCEISELSVLTDVNSYYWSNVGYLKMLKMDTDDALDNYFKSINLIRSKENARSHYGIGLVYMAVYNDFSESRYHFKRAIIDVGKNKNSRYFIICDILLNTIDILMKEKKVPSADFLYSPNILFNVFRNTKKKLNFDTLASIVPNDMFTKI